MYYITAFSSFWFLLTTISVSAFPTSDGAIIYVKPSSASNAACPDQPCITLRDLYIYISDGASFVFLSGVHKLDLACLLIKGRSNVSLSTLEGNGSA